MQKYLTIFFLFICFKVYTQECQLRKDNDDYLLKLDESKDKTFKINLIKEKVLRDKNYIPIQDTTACNLQNDRFKYLMFYNEWKNEAGEKCGKKILNYVFYNKGKAMFEIDEVLYPGSMKILDYLNEKNVEKIINLNAEYSRALFGERGAETSAIVIYTDDKVIKRFILKESKKTKNQLN